MKPLPDSKPPGEDLFLWSVRIDSPNPDWDDGFILCGGWEQTAAQITAWTLKQSGTILAKTDIVLFQGPAARAKIPQFIAEEIRYRRALEKN